MNHNCKLLILEITYGEGKKNGIKTTYQAKEIIKEKIEDKIETYHDLMNRLNLNQETKKIVAEKIEELHKDIDYKIIDRQKKLDEKVKEVEDTLKGKKK